MHQIRRSPRFVCVVSVLALLAGASPTLAVTVEEIPSPRPNGWSVDLTGTIPVETLQEIDRLGNEIRATTGAEIAVVVIDSTGGVPSNDFAIRLFEQWKIGESDEDNGLLLFAALGDRRTELVLGKGFADPASRQFRDEIMQGEIVPRFRAGDPGGALLAGVRACARRILDAAPLPAEVATQATAVTPVAESPAEAPPSLEPAPVPVTAQPASPPRPSSNLPGLLLAILLLGALGTGGYFVLRPPRCRSCRIPMNLLDEKAEDAYLTPVEQTEERIGAVSHNVFLCMQCGTTKKTSWRRSSPYHRCPSCQARARKRTSWIEVEPTYSSEGVRRVSEVCAACQDESSSTVMIPRLVETRNDDVHSSAAAGIAASTSSFSDFTSGSDSGSSGYSGGESSGDSASGSW